MNIPSRLKSAPARDQMRMHFIVLIWGFTGILGALISLRAVDLVIYRTLIASFGLAALLLLKRRPLFNDVKMTIAIAATGLLVGLHWALFFGAVKLGGASVGMIGLSTCTLWTALMRPIFMKQKISLVECMLGLLVVFGLIYIFHAEVSRSMGLTLSIAAGFVAAIFSYLNGFFTKHVHHHYIAFHEMLGALVFCICTFPLMNIYEGRANPFAIQIPAENDLLFLTVLALACTVYPYAECVELLKRLSVFFTNLAVNLEPVYGMILAAIILGEHELLTHDFYIGSAIILSAVMIYPLLRTKLRPAV